MDAVTHVMTGVIIGSAVAIKKEDRLYPLLLTGAFAALAPDLDGAMKPFVSFHDFLLYHRVFTHNVFLLAPLAVITSLPAWIWIRASYLLFYLVSLAVLVSHMALDALCVWPLYLLKPFSDRDFAAHICKEDTSYIALTISTLGAMALIYYHHRRMTSEKPGAGSDSDE